MSNLGIICPPITGHVNPLAALGRVLAGRGHRVTVFHVADLESKVRGEALDFVALGRDEFPAGELASSVAKLTKLSGLKSLKYAIECECRISELILKFGPGAVKDADTDVLLVDQNEPAGASVAEYIGIPFASVCTSLPLNREPLIPPPFVNWRYKDSALARLRNDVGRTISNYFIAPIQATLNRYRTRWNLPVLRTPDDSFSRTTQLAQMPREFDFPRKHLPADFQYLGPWFDDHSDRVSFPFEKLDGRPLIYGSLGTLQSKDSRYFRIMAEACAGLDAQLVLSLGTLDGINIPDLPGDPVVVNYAPQIQLLSRAAVTITHSGMNTTQQSLYFGVPMVAIPLAHDQPAIGARLARTGAGIVLPPQKLTSERLRAALKSVLADNSSHRIQARRMQAASRAAGGAERAADIIEAMSKHTRSATN